MAQTKRDKFKRQLAQAYHDLDRAMAKLLEVKAAFDEHHPDLGKHLEMLAMGCLMTQQGILKFWEHSWGTLPKDINSWRG